jgi:uncharacterized protein YciI
LGAKKLFRVHVLDTRDGKRKAFKREYRSLDELRQKLAFKYPYLTILEAVEIHAREFEPTPEGDEACAIATDTVSPPVETVQSLQMETAAPQSHQVKFKVLGSNPASGAKVEIVLEAADITDAQQIAEQMGIVVAGIMPDNQSVELEASNPVVTTQQTSKSWKACIVVGAVFIFTGFGLLFAGRTGLEWGLILWLLGAATYIVGRVGKFWFHE